MNNQVKVSFQYIEAEYVAASRLLLLKSTKVILRLAVFISLLALGSLMMLSLIGADSFVLLFTLVVIILLPILMLNNLLSRTPQRFFRSNKHFQDRYDISFSDEGVAIRTPEIDSKLAWSLYTKAVEGRDLYLLVYGRDMRMMTAVPKRAFRSNEDEKLFRHLIVSHIADHSGMKLVPGEEDAYVPRSLSPPDWR